MAELGGGGGGGGRRRRKIKWEVEERRRRVREKGRRREGEKEIKRTDILKTKQRKSLISSRRVHKAPTSKLTASYRFQLI